MDDKTWDGFSNWTIEIKKDILEVGFIVAIVLVGVYGVIRVYERWKNKEEEPEHYVNQ